MNSPWGRGALQLLAVLVGFGSTASAQLIPIRTVPLAQGDQFLIYPSNNLGMGGVSVALADSLLDPFRNPALGARVGQARFFGSPAIYSTTQQTGSGATLPLAALGRAGPWFGGLSVALQRVEGSQPVTTVPPPFVALPHPVDPPIPVRQQVFTLPDDRSHGNDYAFASLGRVVSGNGLSIGGGVQWSRLHALDGADLLFPGRQHLAQDGHGLDLRLGLVKEWPGTRSLEVLVLHDRFRMVHDVTYVDVFWDPGTQQFFQVPRIEHALDRTNTSGVHVAYQRPLATSGWRIGWIATLNLVSQPRISVNEIVTLPRDQGHATASNVGVGFSKTRGPGTFGIDLVYEPIWSTTWAVSPVPVVAALGDTIGAGDRTVSNRFRFSNVVLRLGVSRDVALADLQKAVGIQFGLALRSISYRLDQTDRVAAVQQRMRAGWVEWTPTWGVSLRFPEFELRYRGRVTNGMGRPGQPIAVGVVSPLTDVAPGNLLLAPNQSLSLTGVSTVTHQVSLSLPLH